MPDLTGDYFADSLIYVCQHDADGAMGLIVNRPSDMVLAELTAQIGLTTEVAVRDQDIFEGGPVAPDRGIVLHSGDQIFSGTTQVADTLYVSTQIEALQAVAEGQGPARCMIALGYAGWGAGQLDHEIATNVWLSLPAEHDVLFDVEPAARRDAAAAALGFDFRLIAARAGHA